MAEFLVRVLNLPTGVPHRQQIKIGIISETAEKLAAPIALTLGRITPTVLLRRELAQTKHHPCEGPAPRSRFVEGGTPGKTSQNRTLPRRRDDNRHETTYTQEVSDKLDGGRAGSGNAADHEWRRA